MRLVIDIGYQKFLLPEDTNTDAILRALAGAVPVEEKQEDFSKPTMYAIKRDARGITTPEFIMDTQLIDEEAAAEMDIGKLREESSQYFRERNEAKEKLKELEAKIATLTSDESAT